MKKLLKVTIVTVTYNAEDILEDTILNIINQDYRNIEFIIIDGGSTDATLEIIEKYKEKIDYFKSEPDKGIYDAMNKAIDVATGEWINFMNAGDSFVDLNTVSSSMKKLAYDTDVLYGNHYYIDGDKKELRKSDIKKVYSDITFNHQSMFYKTSVIKEYKFDESFKIVADCEMHLKAYKDGKNFQYLNMPVANFLAGGINNKFRINTIIEFIHALALHIPKDKDIRETSIFKLLILENSISINDTLVNSSNVFDSLKRHIERLCSISFMRNPIKKIKSYKALLNYYNLIKEIK